MVAIIAIAATIYLFYILKSKVGTLKLETFWGPLKSNVDLLTIVLLLMPLNWGIELLKWKRLTKKFQYLTFAQATRSILSGIFIGLLTPNRIGELGGRMLFIAKNNRSKALYVNSMCSSSQLIATIVFGLIATIAYADEIALKIHFSNEFILLVGILSTVTLFIYFRSKSLKKIFYFIGRKFVKDDTLKGFEITSKERLELLLLSVLRYIIFGLQFLLLLHAFTSHISTEELCIAVGLIYFCTTIVPTAWLSSLAVRTSFAFLIIDAMGFDGLSGLLASVVLWIINLFIPAVLGLIMLKEVNVMKVSNKRNAES